jgi:hypothetical protein
MLAQASTPPQAAVAAPGAVPAATAVPVNGKAPAPMIDLGTTRRSERRMDFHSWLLLGTVGCVLLAGVIGLLLVVRSSKGNRAGSSEATRQVRPVSGPRQNASLYPGATFLADLGEVALEVGPAGSFAKSGDLGTGRKIVVRGVPVTKGLAMKGSSGSPASVTYQLGGQYIAFRTAVALSDRSDTPARSPRVRFEVWADDGEAPLWRKEITYGRREECEVPVSGVDQLRLTVRVAGNRDTATDPVWIDPRLYKDAQ